MMGVLAHCQDGEEIAHEWSQGDERYDEQETQDKYDRSAAIGAPVTCAHFAGINPEGCNGCPFSGRITTPVQLGRGHPADVAEHARTADVGVIAGSRSAAVLGEAGDLDRKLALPEGFSTSDGGRGLAFIHEDKKGGTRRIQICKNDVELVSVAKGEIKDRAVTYVIKYNVPSEGWQKVELPAAKLAGPTGAAELAGVGLVVDHWDGFKQWLRAAHNDYIETQKLARMYEQSGWKENDTAFLAGCRLYRPDGTITEVPGSDELHYRSNLIGPKEGGSLDAWKTAVAGLFGHARPASTFAMLCGFGAPFVRFLSSGEGGGIVSLVGPSGRGKSTGAFGAASIWGDEHGTKLINGDTYNTRSITFGVLGNLPCIMDDLDQRDPERMRDFIQLFTDGRDKMRGTRDGGIRHVLAQWQTLLVTGSNASVRDTVNATGGSDAMSFRILELDADELNLTKDDKKRGDRLIADMKSNSGLAGDVFLRYLVRPDVLPEVKQKVGQIQQDLIDKHNFSSEHRFWTRSLAAVAMGHRIAYLLGLVPWPVGVILDWAIDQTKEAADVGVSTFKDGVMSLGQTMRAPMLAKTYERPEQMLSSFLNEHVPDTLVVDDQYHMAKDIRPIVRKLPTRHLMVRVELKPRRVYIDELALKRWVQKRDMPWKYFVQRLIDIGVFKHSRLDKALGEGTDMISGRLPTVMIDASHPAMTGAVTFDVVPKVVEVKKGSA